MELIAIGFLLGVVVCFVIAGASVIYADRKINKRRDKENEQKNVL